MKKSALLLSLSLISITACSDISEEVYSNQHKAAAAWYNKYYDVAEGLTEDEELMGFVLNCKDGYRYSGYEIGGISNTFSTKDKISGCEKVAHLHTHPILHLGWTNDFFSKVDLKTAKNFDIYVMSINSCNMRWAHKGNYENKYGHLLGKVKNCTKGSHYRG